MIALTKNLFLSHKPFCVGVCVSFKLAFSANEKAAVLCKKTITFFCNLLTSMAQFLFISTQLHRKEVNDEADWGNL